MVKSMTGAQVITHNFGSTMYRFLMKHRNCKGFMPGDEARARKKAKIGNTYYCCYTCGERLIRQVKVERFGK